jgi:hypothetical protein
VPPTWVNPALVKLVFSVVFSRSFTCPITLFTWFQLLDELIYLQNIVQFESVATMATTAKKEWRESDLSSCDSYYSDIEPDM